MGRKAKYTPQEKLAYHGRLAALVLPSEFVAEVHRALPHINTKRIENARKGMVVDMEVLNQLELISNRERGRRASAQLQVAA